MRWLKKNLWLWSRKYNDSHLSSGAIISVIKMFFSQQPFIQFIRTIKPNRAPQIQAIHFQNSSFALSQQKYSIFHSVLFILSCIVPLSLKKKDYGILVVKGFCKECKHLFCKFLMHKLQALQPFHLLMEELLNSVSTQVSAGLLRELPLLKLIVPFCLSVLKPTRADYALIKLHFTMH